MCTCKNHKTKKYLILLNGHLQDSQSFSIDQAMSVIEDMINIDGHNLDEIDLVQCVDFNLTMKVSVSVDDTSHCTQDI